MTRGIERTICKDFIPYAEKCGRDPQTFRPSRRAAACRELRANGPKDRVCRSWLEKAWSGGFSTPTRLRQIFEGMRVPPSAGVAAQ